MHRRNPGTILSGGTVPKHCLLPSCQKAIQESSVRQHGLILYKISVHPAHIFLRVFRLCQELLNNTLIRLLFPRHASGQLIQDRNVHNRDTLYYNVRILLPFLITPEVYDRVNQLLHLSNV